MSGWVWFEEHVKTAILVRLTDHSSKPPSPVLRLHRRSFIRRRDRGKINTNADKGVNGHAQPLSQRSLRLQPSSSPHIERLMGILLLLRRTRLFPRRSRRIGTLPRKRWVVLSPNPSKMLPPLSPFQSRGIFNGIFNFVSKSSQNEETRQLESQESKHTTTVTIPSILDLRALLFRRLNLWRRLLLALLICFYPLIIPAPPHRPWEIVCKSESRPFIFFSHPRIQSQITRVKVSLVLVEPRRWCRGSRQRVVKIIILARALAARTDIVQVSEVLLWDVIKGVPFFCSCCVLSWSVAAVAEV
jgi:hypothetical protein